MRIFFGLAHRDSGDGASQIRLIGGRDRMDLADLLRVVAFWVGDGRGTAVAILRHRGRRRGHGVSKDGTGHPALIFPRNASLADGRAGRVSETTRIGSPLAHQSILRRFRFGHGLGWSVFTVTGMVP